MWYDDQLKKFYKFKLMTEEIIDFTKKRLRKTPVVYTVTFYHNEKGMSFTVDDIQDTKKDRLAVARDFEAAACSLKED